MAAITGSLRDIVGVTLGNRQGVLVFTLNKPQIIAATSSAGRVIPTEPAVVTPDATGLFTANLAPVTSMRDDAWYTLQIRWLGSAGAVTDFPDWEIRPGLKDAPLSDVIYSRGGTSGGSNKSLVLMGLTEPPNLGNGQLWWKTDPIDPYGPANTGLIYIGG